MTQNKKIILYITQSIGIGISLILIIFAGDMIHKNLLAASFAASLIILFTCYDNQFSRAKNVIGSYMICSVVGILAYHIGGNGIFTIAIAVGISTFIMRFTQLMHPPAGAVTIIAITTGASWSFVFYPVILGSFLIVFFAMIYNQIVTKVERFRNTHQNIKEEESKEEEIKAVGL